jgi:hypothetical protein
MAGVQAAPGSWTLDRGRIERVIEPGRLDMGAAVAEARRGTETVIVGAAAPCIRPGLGLTLGEDSRRICEPRPLVGVARVPGFAALRRWSTMPP